MATKRTKETGTAGSKKGGSKKQGMRLKDLDVKKARMVRGGYKMKIQ